MLSTLIQDIGRACGYKREAPCIFLSKVAHELLHGGLENARIDRFLVGAVGSSVLVPTKDSMWARVLETQDKEVIRHLQTRRILFMAMPQSGKTGVALSLIKMIMQSKSTKGK